MTNNEQCRAEFEAEMIKGITDETLYLIPEIIGRNGQGYSSPLTQGKWSFWLKAWNSARTHDEAAIRRNALERAARVCDTVSVAFLMNNGESDLESDIANHCAKAIRALAGEDKNNDR